ncbi:MAG: hypothetical protein HKO76_08945, partial [Acidimicrobiia bacterium]|nr:hypothetical protein [Acidimicrobiia bacterium]
MSLDSYLEGLTKEAEQERVEKVYLKTASDEELMSLVGIQSSDRREHAGKTKEAKIPKVMRDAALGGVVGATRGGYQLDEDRLKGALGGALLGGVLGAVGGKLWG